MEATAAPALAEFGAPDPHTASVAIAACVEGRSCKHARHETLTRAPRSISL